MFEFPLENMNAENVDFLLKTGSVAECTFSEITKEDGNVQGTSQRLFILITFISNFL